MHSTHTRFTELHDLLIGGPDLLIQAHRPSLPLTRRRPQNLLLHLFRWPRR